MTMTIIVGGDSDLDDFVPHAEEYAFNSKI